MPHGRNFPMRQQFILTTVIVLLFAADVQARDDFQYRQLLTLKLIDTKKIDLVIFNQVRFNQDAQNLNFYATGPQIKFDLWKNLQLGLNYTYLNLKTFDAAIGSDEFGFHHRLELEVNPRWDIGVFKLTTRNRYEFRWIEDKGSDNPRFRHRTNIELPLKGVLPILSVYANSEFFYDINDHRYNENWTVPLGVKFKINDQANFSVFYMVTTRLTDTWTGAQVLGTHVMINF